MTRAALLELLNGLLPVAGVRGRRRPAPRGPGSPT
jgi:hypothetical protein